MAELGNDLLLSLLAKVAPQNPLHVMQIILLASWHCHCPTYYYCGYFKFIF